MSDVTVTYDRDDEQHVAHVGDQRAGVLRQRAEDGRHVLVSTEVDDEFEGEGVGSALVEAALRTARTEDARIVPLCSFVAHWLEEHPEERDLVDEERTAQLREGD